MRHKESNSSELQSIFHQVTQIYVRLRQLRLSYRLLDGACFSVDKDSKVWLVRIDRAKLHRMDWAFNLATYRNWQQLLMSFQEHKSVVNFLQQSLAKATEE